MTIELIKPDTAFLLCLFIAYYCDMAISFGVYRHKFMEFQHRNKFILSIVSMRTYLHTWELTR